MLSAALHCERMPLSKKDFILFCLASAVLGSPFTGSIPPRLSRAMHDTATIEAVDLHCRAGPEA